MVGFADWWGLARVPRALARAGCSVTSFSPRGQLIASSRFVSRRVFGPDDLEAFADALAEHLEGASYDHVVLGDEPVLQRAAAAPAGSALRRALPVGEDLADTLAAKDAFLALAASAGVPIPRWESAIGPDQARQAAERLGGDVFVKTPRSWGGIAVRPAATPDAAAEAAIELGGGPVVLQERVPGRIGFVCALWDRGVLRACLPSHKATTFPGRLGGSASLCIVDVPGLVDAVGDIGRALGFHGLGGVDWIHREDGSFRVIELHPRPTSHVHLCERLGADFSRAFADMLEGRPVDEILLPDARWRERWLPMFPTELLRCVDDRHWAGIPRALSRPFIWRDMPWDDPGLFAKLPVTVLSKRATRSLRRGAAVGRSG